MRKKNFTLTDSEWLVLERLWEAPSTLMELVRALGQDPPGWAKSTTATMLRRLEEKGLVRHENGGKAKIFTAAVSRDEAALAETQSLVDKAFDGSVGLLVNTLVRRQTLSKEDIDALYGILREAEEQEESK